jgi:drug/metabolite transporter (DMT)-like permease
VLPLSAAIPISMALSVCFLKARFGRFQYWGAGLVIAGLVIATLPDLEGEGTAKLAGAQTSLQPAWIALLVLR